MKRRICIYHPRRPVKIHIELDGDADGDTFSWREVSGPKQYLLQQEGRGTIGPGDQWALHGKLSVQGGNRPALRLQVRPGCTFGVDDVPFGAVLEIAPNASFPGGTGWLWKFDP